MFWFTVACVSWIVVWGLVGYFSVRALLAHLAYKRACRMMQRLHEQKELLRKRII